MSLLPLFTKASDPAKEHSPWKRLLSCLGVGGALGFVVQNSIRKENPADSTAMLAFWAVLGLSFFGWIYLELRDFVMARRRVSPLRRWKVAEVFVHPVMLLPYFLVTVVTAAILDHYLSP